MAELGTPVRRPRRVRAGTRLLIAALAGIAAGVVIAVLGLARYGIGAGWVIACLVYLRWIWATIWPMNAAQTRNHSSWEDSTRAGVDLILVLAALASLFAVGYYLISAGSKDALERDIMAGLGVLIVAVSWATVHTVYAVRYADLYYDAGADGIDFGSKEPPTYRDFAYLSFTIGMTYQVSDTTLQAPAIRHAALRHALLSFVFGAVILGATVNLVAGLGG